MTMQAQPQPAQTQQQPDQLAYLISEVEREQARFQKMVAAPGGVKPEAAMREIALTVLPLIVDGLRAQAVLRDQVWEAVDEIEHDLQAVEAGVAGGSALDPEEMTVLQQACEALKLLAGELLAGKAPAGEGAAATLQGLVELSDRGLAILASIGEDEEEGEAATDGGA